MGHRKFTTIQKSCGWTYAYRKIMERFGADQTDQVFDKAQELYRSFALRYSNETGIRGGHIKGAVAIASLYIPLSELIGKEQAVDWITGKMFSEKAGFQRKWHCNTNREKRFDLLTCPYVQVFKELGCIEVCPAVCVQDDLSFSGMKNGVIFERKGTLGRGDDCCDFCFKIEVNK